MNPKVHRQDTPTKLKAVAHSVTFNYGTQLLAYCSRYAFGLQPS